MVKKQENKSSFLIILVSGSVLLSVVIGLFVGRTYYIKLQETEKKLVARKTVSNALETKLERLKVLKEKEAELTEKNKKVLAAIPKDRDVPRLFKQFEDIMTSSGIITDEVKEQDENSLTSGTSSSTVTTIDPSVAKKVAYNYTAVPFDYLSLKIALQKFEEALRLLSIEEITLEKSEGEGYKLELNLSTYERSTEK